MSHSKDLSARGKDSAVVGVDIRVEDSGHWQFSWKCEKWEQDKVDHVLAKLVQDDDPRLLRFDSKIVPGHSDILVPHYDPKVRGRTNWRPSSDGLPSSFLREAQMSPDDILVVDSNLLVNEGIQRLLDLLIAAGGTSYNNANAFIGVGDSATAEAATQTELQAATNRFYKAMRTAGFPVRPGSNGAQSVDWSADFTTTEANYVWAEWSVSAGATTASGAGFTTGTTNLNRKVQTLGTKATGTWTLTGTVTIS
jgi:hypothetical protein